MSGWDLWGCPGKLNLWLENAKGSVSVGSTTITQPQCATLKWTSKSDQLSNPTDQPEDLTDTNQQGDDMDKHDWHKIDPNDSSTWPKDGDFDTKDSVYVATSSKELWICHRDSFNASNLKYKGATHWRRTGLTYPPDGEWVHLVGPEHPDQHTAEGPVGTKETAKQSEEPVGKGKSFTVSLTVQENEPENPTPIIYDGEVFIYPGEWQKDHEFAGEVRTVKLGDIYEFDGYAVVWEGEAESIHSYPILRKKWQAPECLRGKGLCLQPHGYNSWQITRGLDGNAIIRFDRNEHWFAELIGLTLPPERKVYEL